MSAKLPIIGMKIEGESLLEKYKIKNKILIAIAVYDTDQNKRNAYTQATFKSLLETVNFNTTRIVFIDNDSCLKTKKFLAKIENKGKIDVIFNEDNVGTAEAINKAWFKFDEPEQFKVKLDNDVTFGSYGWADEMAKCFNRDPKLGILGLKRKDLPNAPDSKEYPTTLKYLPRQKGEPWGVPVEVCGDIIGTCLMFAPKLLDKIGYLYQPGLYAFDDCLACVRSIVGGFYNAFLPGIDIEHLDDGKNPYTDWKKKYAGLMMSTFEEIEKGYRDGTRSIYYNPFM